MTPVTVLILPADWEDRYEKWKKRPKDEAIRTVRLPERVTVSIDATAETFGLSAGALTTLFLTAAMTPRDEAYVAYFLAIEATNGDWRKSLQLYGKLRPLVSIGFQVEAAG